MDCAESLRVQAYFDGEVDAASTIAIERHLETCPVCRTLLHELEQVRGLVRDQEAPEGMPPALQRRVLEALDREPEPVKRSRPFWIGVLSGVVGSLAAAVAAFLLLSPWFNGGLVKDLVADHVHSLMSSHLIDVVSTDRHTVKPWFAGRTDVSPVVADFAAQGYRLLGGRVDDLDHQRAAVVVYQHGPHFINVFSWAVGVRGVPHDATRNGYHLVFWRVGNLGYCAVSDTGWNELRGLVRLLQEQAE